ncbi:MAG TPA: hypothetical protein VGV59_07610 [Pyrinomonadaceae bacterium]|nr:hypothetical protein [Pyrinomonadaceae bacterium]
MLTNNKLLPVALVAALLGGSVGAFVMRPSTKVADASQTAAPAHNLTPAAATTTENATAKTTEVASNELSEENEAFRDGFTEGVRAARAEGLAAETAATQTRTNEATRVVYRNAPARTRVARSGGSRQVYYDYQQPQKRSFWQKHRDKLTVAAGTGGGALIGGLIGGKKGALIGGLAGAGGSALYTYKIRKRNRRF